MPIDEKAEVLRDLARQLGGQSGRCLTNPGPNPIQTGSRTGAIIVVDMLE